jgi:hypothetical protein
MAFEKIEQQEPVVLVRWDKKFAGSLRIPRAAVPRDCPAYGAPLSFDESSAQ